MLYIYFYFLAFIKPILINLAKFKIEVQKQLGEVKEEVAALREQVTLLRTHWGGSNNVTKDKGQLDALMTHLSLKTVDELNSFEDLLTEESYKIALGYVYEHQGGEHAKDFVKRCLRKIFHVLLSKQCSWTGAKKNFKIKDLKIIKILEDVALKRNITLREVEKIGMEWFRQQNTNFKRYQQDLPPCQEVPNS